MSASPPRLDVIAIGRSSVDLYGAQIGGRFEDMASFSKAVGGCPSNLAIGTARLGLSGLLIRTPALRCDQDLNHIHWTTTRDALTPRHAHPHHGVRDRPPRATLGFRPH
jgi:hypothetical protein